MHPDCVAAAEAAARLLESLGHHVEVSHPKAMDDPDYTGHFITFWAAGAAWSLDYWSRRTGDPITADDVEPLTWALAELGRSGSAADWLTAREWLQLNAREVAGWWTEGHDLLLTPDHRRAAAAARHLRQPARTTRCTACSAPPSSCPSRRRSTSPASRPSRCRCTGTPTGSRSVCSSSRPFGREDVLLRVAAQLEAAQPWADRRPPVHA